MKNNNTGTHGSHMSSNKKMAIILTAVLLIVLTVSLLLAFLLPKEDKLVSDGGKGETTKIENTNESKDTLIGVGSDFSFLVSSELSISDLKLNITIRDQLGEVVENKVVREADNYSIEAPKDGYFEGSTYKVLLLDGNISFLDKTYSDKRDITFSIHKEAINNVIPKEEIKKVVSDTMYIFDAHAGEIIMDKATYSKHSLCVGDLVSLPIFDNGFKADKLYRIDKAADVFNGIKLNVTVPELEDVYSELEIYDKFEAKYVEDNFIFYDEAEVAAQLAKDPVVMDIGAAVRSEPEISLNVELSASKVSMTITIVFSDIALADFTIDLEIEGTFSIELATIANINIWKGAFDVGAAVAIKSEMKFTYTTEKEIVDAEKDLFEKQTKALEKYLNETVQNRSTSMKAFKTFISTPIPGLGFSFEVEVVFEINLKAELKFTLTNEFELSVGVKKDSDGLNAYFNKASVCNATEVELTGTIEAKLGLEVDFAGSLCGILNAGVSFEIGAYAKLSGLFSISSIHEISLDEGAQSDADVTFALYLELGIYSSLSVFAEVDLWFWSHEIKHSILEVELPIFSIGNSLYSTVRPASNTVTLDESGAAQLPDMIITTEDMLSGKTSDKTIKSSEVSENFEFEKNGDEDYYVQNNKVVQNSSAPAEFEDTLTIKLNDWSRDKLQFENSELGTENGKALFHYEIRFKKVRTTIDITKKPIFIESVKLGFDQVTDDPEYKDLYGFSAPYNVRNNIESGLEDYQIGRIVSIYPIIDPTNASYQAFNYAIIYGGEFIQDFKQFTVNGVSKASFRIKCDDAIIGREIKITAVSTGYVGKYSDKNVQTDAHDKVVASTIPVEDYSFGPMIDGVHLNKSAVVPEEIIEFSIKDESVVPVNATRGANGGENITITSGNAVVVSQGDNIVKIKVNDSAEVGDQIIVTSNLTGIKRNYSISVVKQSVADVEISATHDETIIANSEIAIAATVLGVDGGNTTVKDVEFILINGYDIATIIVDSGNKNTGKILVNNEAKSGEIISVLAMIDSVVSNTLSFTIGRIEVQKVVVDSDVLDGTVEVGDIVNLSSSVIPANAENKEVTYKIVSGGQYVVFDAISGKLIINYTCLGGEVISVIASADGVNSEVLNFVVKTNPVIFVEFAGSVLESVLDGQDITLDAKVNSNASNKGVTYTLVTGMEFATINGNILSINSGLNEFDLIKVNATSVSNPDITAFKTFTIFKPLGAVTIDGKVDSVYLLADCLNKIRTYTIEVTDVDGDIVKNNTLDLAVENVKGGYSIIAKISEHGVISFHNIGSHSAIHDIIIVATDPLTNSELKLYVNLILPPDETRLIYEENEDINELTVSAFEPFKLKLNVYDQPNGSSSEHMANMNVIIDGNAEAVVKTTVAAYGIKSYSVHGKVIAGLDASETIKIKVGYYIFDEYFETEEFIIKSDKYFDKITIHNAPERIDIGSSIQLKYRMYPYFTSDEVEYILSSRYSDIAKIDTATGFLEIYNDKANIGKIINVNVKYKSIVSIPYEIMITENISSVSIESASNSKNVTYIESKNYYFMNPNGTFVIDSSVGDGTGDESIKYALDGVGKEYFTITNSVLTVNKNANVNSGISATLVAYYNGIKSNTVTIYIPQTINTIEDWYSIKDLTTGNYILGNDIDFSGREYVPLEKFDGVLDAAGYSIRNVSISKLTDNKNAGLFEINTGIIMNLFVRDMSIDIGGKDKGRVNVGGIAAKNYGTIQNCMMISYNIEFFRIQYENVVAGGIAGENQGIINECSNDVFIIGRSSSIGGIVGVNKIDGLVNKCVNYDVIQVNGYDYKKAVKGIIGTNDGQVIDCINYGRVYDANIGQNV